MSKNKFSAHVCKKCGKSFISEDLGNNKSRCSNLKYCDACCQKYNFTNPVIKPKKELTEKQIEVLRKNQFVKRQKSVLSDENVFFDDIHQNGGCNEI